MTPAGRGRPLTAADLRRHARARTLFAPRELAAAIDALGFVQIDPLRAPARAQDLILRHRVPGYRVGDLDAAWGTLPLVEEFLHVHGVMPARLRRLVHPRVVSRDWHVEREHPGLAARILDYIGAHGPTHPRDLQAAFGRAAVRNGWGGRSAATTRLLEVLHYRGALGVARREGAVKVYRLATPVERPLAPARRLRGVLELLLRLYAPLPLATLRELVRMAGDDAFDAAARERALTAFACGPRVASAVVDGLTYLWPADERAGGDADERVRLVAPFDPLVWDRRRFAHLHGWDYRFEAYTPAARRRYGYYALPLVWGDRVIGWANVARSANGVDVSSGYVERRPAGRAFARALEAEVAALEAFLSPRAVPVATPSQSARSGAARGRQREAGRR